MGSSPTKPVMPVSRTAVSHQRQPEPFVDIAATWSLNWSAPVLIHRQHTGMLGFLQRYEPHVIAFMLSVFRSACGSGLSRRANDGAWSLLAGASGCDVVAVEPQPLCTRLLHEAVRANMMHARVAVYENTLSTETYESQVPNDRCGGETQFLLDGRLATAFGWDERRFNRSLTISPRVASALRQQLSQPLELPKLRAMLQRS